MYIELEPNEIRGIIYLLGNEINNLTPLIEEGLPINLVSAKTDLPLTATERAEAFEAIKDSLEASTSLLEKLSKVLKSTPRNLQ